MSTPAALSVLGIRPFSSGRSPRLVGASMMSIGFRRTRASTVCAAAADNIAITNVRRSIASRPVSIGSSSPLFDAEEASPSKPPCSWQNCTYGHALLARDDEPCPALRDRHQLDGVDVK